MKIARFRARKTIAFFVLFCFAMVVYETATAQELDTVKLDRLFNYLADKNEAMGSLAMSKNGNILYQKSIGYRFISNDQKIPADTQTKYRIWSITKIYTATMILQMVEERKLALETTLDRFFPEIANAEIITIKEMLNHTSGVHDFTDSGEVTAKSQRQTDMVEMISKFDPDFQPGEKFQYSNSNYLLLGYIIEKLDSVSYSKALSNRISSKIALSDTYYGVGSLDRIENKSLSYRWDNDKWVEVDEGDFSGLVPGGAGSIVSTPSEMVSFIEALFGGQLVSEKSLAEMTDISEFYGLGIMLKPNQWSNGFGHGGGYIASHANLLYYPQDSLAIAYCTNGHVYGMDKILGHVMQIYYDKSYMLPFDRPTIELNEKILQRYVGAYQTPRFLLTISREGNHLTAQPEGQPKSDLYALSETRFFLKDINIEMEFHSNEEGKVDSVFIFQGERKMDGEKIN